MKETIISISKPIQKLPIEPEPELEIPQTPEIGESEQSQQPEPIVLTQPVSRSFGNTNYGGWKESDILREIRLDNFDIGDLD